MNDIEKNLLELEKNFSELKKYYDYDGIEYKGIRDIRNLFNLSTDEDYNKPIKSIILLIETVLNMKGKEMKIKLYQLKNI